MAWAVPAPDLAPPPGLRPSAAVFDGSVNSVAADRLRRDAEELERKIAENRAEFSVKMRGLLLLIASAELDGWELDVERPIRSTEASIAALRKQVESLAKTLAGLPSPSHRANGDEDGGGRIVRAFEHAVKDLEDYRAELHAVRDRMKIYRKTTPPIVKAENAYRAAFEKLFGGDLNIDSWPDDIDGTLTLRLRVPVRGDLLADPGRLLQLESRVHDEVARQDSSLVGKIAIDYVLTD